MSKTKIIKNIKHGIVFWITGFPGSGKTKTVVGGIVNTAYNHSNTSGANNIHTWSPKGQYFADTPSRITGVKTELPVYDVFNLIKVVD